MGLTIGVDIGGTKVAAGVVDEQGRILARALAATPAGDARAVVETIVGSVARLVDEFTVEAVGLGAAGFIDAGRSTVLFASNLSWRDEPLRAVVARRVGLPVVVENDANAAAWAESRFGAGTGEPDLALVTVGTGIGGGIVLDGRLYRGRFGVAGEFGHIRVVPDGLLCGCGNRGCWEMYASGNALVRQAREMVAAGSPRVAGLLARVGGDPSAITGPVVTDAATAGDPGAIELFEDVGRWLGVGLAGLSSVLDPGRFVIGGGVAEAGELLLGPCRETYLTSLPGRGHRPEAQIVGASLGNDAGLVGAADLARHRS